MWYKIKAIGEEVSFRRKATEKQILTFIDFFVAKDIARGLNYWLHYFYDLRQKKKDNIHFFKCFLWFLLVFVSRRVCCFFKEKKQCSINTLAKNTFQNKMHDLERLSMLCMGARCLHQCCIKHLKNRTIGQRRIA